MSGRSAEGQSMAEFALVLPVFLILLMALFDFGRAIYGYNTISNAARAGTRLWIVDQNEAAVIARAMQHTVGMNPDDVSVTVSDACPDPPKIGCEGQVTVTYEYTPLTPLIDSIIGPIEMESVTRLRLERVYSSP